MEQSDASSQQIINATILFRASEKQPLNSDEAVEIGVCDE